MSCYLALPPFYYYYSFYWCVRNLDGYSHLAFPGHTGNCLFLAFASAVRKKKKVPANAWLHPALDRRWKASLLGSNLPSSQGAPASLGCALPGIRLSWAPAGLQWKREIALNTKSGTSDYSFPAVLNLVTHPKIINQQQPLLWRAMSPPQIQPAP